MIEDVRRWDPNPLRFRLGIGFFSALSFAPLLATVGIGLATAAPAYPAIAGFLGVYALYQGLRIYKKECAHTFCDDVPSRPTPPALQSIVNRLRDKAGISDDIALIIDAEYDGKALLSAYARPRSEDNARVISAGKSTPDFMTVDEMSATMAHEVGHIMVKSPQASPLFKFGEKLAEGILYGSILTLNLPLVISGLCATFLFKVCRAEAFKLDERRADRNSIGLYPHETALQTALDKCFKELAAEKGVDPSIRDGLGYNFMNRLLARHDAPNTRREKIGQYFAESAACHENVETARQDIAGRKFTEEEAQMPASAFLEKNSANFLRRLILQ